MVRRKHALNGNLEYQSGVYHGIQYSMCNIFKIQLLFITGNKDIFLYNYINSFRDDAHAMDVLCIAEWNGVLSFYNIGGEVVKRERSLNFIPLKVIHFPEGQYLLVCGSNKQCLLMTHDGIQLVNVGGIFSSWVWSCAVHPTGSHIVSCSTLCL